MAHGPLDLAWRDAADHPGPALTVAAVIATLIVSVLLFDGLRFGITDRLAARFEEDPLARQLTPGGDEVFMRRWMADWAAREDVATVVPTFTPDVPVRLVVSTPTGEASVRALATAPGDPRVIAPDLELLAEGGIVLPPALAKQLGAAAGSEVRVQVMGAGGELMPNAVADLTVAGVIHPQAAAHTDYEGAVLTAIEFLHDAAGARYGIAAPDRGWPGRTAAPEPVYDGALILSDYAVSPEILNEVLRETPFSILRPVSATEFLRLYGFTPDEDAFAYVVAPARGTTAPEMVETLALQVARLEVTVSPFVSPLTIDLDANLSLEVMGYPSALGGRALVGFPEPPWGAAADRSTAFDARAQIALPPAIRDEVAGILDDAGMIVSARTIAEPAAFPITESAPALGDQALIPMRLAGELRAARDSVVRYSPALNDFKRETDRFTEVHVFAASARDLPRLYHELYDDRGAVSAPVEAYLRLVRTAQGFSVISMGAAILAAGVVVVLITVTGWRAVGRQAEALSIAGRGGRMGQGLIFFPVVQAVFWGAFGILFGLVVWAPLGAGAVGLMDTIFGPGTAQAADPRTLDWLLTAALICVVAPSLIGVARAFWEASPAPSPEDILEIDQAIERGV